MLKFWTKNELYGYFWARIVEKILSYLKSAPSNMDFSKIPGKNNNT